MNAPYPLQHALNQPPAPATEDVEVDLRDYWDILVDNRWLIGAATLAAAPLGLAFVLLAKPIYESNLLIQVEDSAASARGFLGETASLFDVKTPATAEMEILRSRMVIGEAVDAALYYVEAKPLYLPLVGDWLARRADSLSTPIKGWVHGKERIELTAFDVAQEHEGERYILRAGPGGAYTLSGPGLPAIQGAVGQPLRSGPVSLNVVVLDGLPGAEFVLVRNSRLKAIETLQEQLKIAEKGRQSGVIETTLRGSQPIRVAQILNGIAQSYVRQNVERKAAEAKKTLAFLDVQLPQFKKQLEQSEDAYSRYRNQKGTVSIDEETKLVLARHVDFSAKLLEAQQRRRELVSRFTAEHPAVRTLDAQIAAWNQEIAALDVRVRGLPTVQQDAIRLERDVKVANELYQQLRNNALQLQLIREGKIGNVRLIDPASNPEDPVQPKPAVILPLAGLVGLLLGVVVALTRNTFFRGVRNPREIEAQTGIDVFGTIPLSELQNTLAQRVAQKTPGVHLLALDAPNDPAVESLRSLSTALQFAMLDTVNNRLLITGATPGVGKSFVSSNFAVVMASSGKRVLLVDCDLRKGHLNQYFGLPRARGLSELIGGGLELEEVLHREVAPNLDFITTGVFPPNPATLLMNSGFTRFLEKVSGDYDLVIIDSPPVLAAADTLTMAPQVGTLLLVARAGLTQIGEVHESTRRLQHAGKSVTGVLFNALDLTRRYYGSYGYRYGGYKYNSYKYKEYSYAPQGSSN
jgi:tyrosine-protein kinase Etk/Wzc